MDSPKSTNAGPRRTPIPSAPPYKRNRKPPNLPAIIGGSLAAVGALAALIFAFTSSKLAIENVDIDGVAAPKAAMLQQMIPFDPIGHNLFSYALLHGASLRKSMASAEPNFASASVGIRLPHTLTVQIVNRNPFALLAVGTNGEGGTWILDDRGVPIFAGRSEGYTSGLPKIELPDDNGAAIQPPADLDASQSGPDQLPIGETQTAYTPAESVVLGKILPTDMAAQVAEAYGLFPLVKNMPGLGPVASIDVDKFQNLGLNMTNDLRIKLGQPKQLTAKLSLVASLLTQRPEIAAQAAYIDVSYPERPAMMPKNATKSQAADDASASKSVAGGATL